MRKSLFKFHVLNFAVNNQRLFYHVQSYLYIIIICDLLNYDKIVRGEIHTENSVHRIEQHFSHAVLIYKIKTKSHGMWLPLYKMQEYENKF